MRSPLHVLVAAFLGLAGLTAARAQAAPIKVACVGDSITQNSGWSDKLGAKLGAGYTSTNYGVSGTTLLKKGDAPYWATDAFTQSHAANPDIVVIMLGTNDSKPFNWSAHKGEFVGDYEALVDSYAALSSHPKIYLNLCPPAGTNGYAIVGSVIENEILPDIEQVAAAKGLPTIDVFDAFGGHTLDPSLYGSAADLVHPNAKGAQVIADTVYAALTAPPKDGGADAASKDVGVDARADDAGPPADGASADAGPSTRDAPVSTDGAGASDAAAGAGGAGGGTTGAAGTTGTATGAAGTSGTPHATASSGGCALGAGARLPAWLALLGLAAIGFVRRRSSR